MNVGIVCDFVEEHWYSMDLAADLLFDSLGQLPGMFPERICPPMSRRFSAVPCLGRTRLARNADRLIGRHIDYSRRLASHSRPDLFHIVDQSYANLVHTLPAERVVVSCHDLDAFGCLFEPERERRSWLFRHLAKRIWNGLRKAARVVCDSRATRDALAARGDWEPECLQVSPLPAHPSYSAEPEPVSDAEAARLLGTPDPERPEILHVGSVVARKRIDRLLRVFAAVRDRIPRARLVRVGGAFTPEQRELVRRLNLDGAVAVLPFLSRPVLAAVYRRAATVLFPSEREGFGLPVAEAIACGSPVIATDLPALRETGGAAAVYCRPSDLGEWLEQTTRIIAEWAEHGIDWHKRRQACIQRAASFSGIEYARRMSRIYREVLQLHGR